MPQRQNRSECVRPSLWRRMRAQYDRATLRQLRAELTGKREIVLEGCCEILRYERGCIMLSVRDPDARAVCIEGRDLLCLSYHADGVVIRGDIERIVLCDGET